MYYIASRWRLSCLLQTISSFSLANSGESCVFYPVHIGDFQRFILPFMMMNMMICFCGKVDRWKVSRLISNQHHCQRSRSIANLRHPASRIWTCAGPEYRLWWMKLCCGDNHYTTAPQFVTLFIESLFILGNTKYNTYKYEIT